MHALTSRGIVTNLVGYNIFGSNLDETDPSSDLIKAVEKGDIDLALGVGAYRWVLRPVFPSAAGCLAYGGRFIESQPAAQL